MSITSDKLETLLSEWNNLKRQLEKLNKQDERIKKLIHQELDTLDKDKLESDTYTVSRKKIYRDSLGKKDIPSNIWNEYKKSSSYYTLTLKKIDEE